MKKRWHGFEKEQGGVCGKIGREEMIQSQYLKIILKGFYKNPKMSIILAIVICISDAKSMMMQPAGILAHSSSMGSRAVVLSGWAGYKKK